MVHDRLKAVREALKMSQAAFAKGLGLKQGSYSSIENENKKSVITAQTELLLSYVYNVNIDYLYGKSDKMFLDNESPIMNTEKGVPYYDVDFICGFDELENDQTRTPTCLIWFPKYERADCWCSVSGMSMYPDICPGDIIALKEIHDFASMPYGEIYGIVTGEHRTVKRICKSDKEGCIRLVPTNKSEDYSPQDIPLRKVVKIYKVLAAVHKF